MKNIEKDIKDAERILEFLRRNQAANCRVGRPNYLDTPTCDFGNTLPMNHRLGINAHIQEIARVLRKAYYTGRISRDEVPVNAPAYLEMYSFL